MSIKIPLVGKQPNKIGLLSRDFSYALNKTKNRSFSLQDYNEKTNPEDEDYIENIELSGFTINFRQYRQITDLRGFDIHVPDSNISFLLMNTVILNGTIMEPCKYLRRHGGTYWLAPVRFL